MEFTKKVIDNVSFIDANEKNPNTIVILHGWKQNKESWSEVIKILSKEYRVICFDIPGFGESFYKEFLTFDIEDYGKLIFKILNDLNIKQFDLICHSFGGRIGIKITHQHQESIKHLILYSSAGLIRKDLKLKIIDFILPFKNIIKRIIPEGTLANFRSRDYNASDELKQIFLKGIKYSIEGLLKDIKVPTLILWGDKDNELGLEYAHTFNNLITNSNLEILKGQDHFAHINSPHLFSSKVKTFLKDN